MSKTTNYQLTVWDYGDEDFTPGQVREDLAENFTALDGALKAEETIRAKAIKELVVVGTYMGNGEASQTIQLGFMPRAVFAVNSDGKISDNYRCYAGLVVTGHNMVNSRDEEILTLTGSGFTVYYMSDSNSMVPRTNDKNTVYNYVALR